MALQKINSNTAFQQFKNNLYAGWPERGSSHDRFDGIAAPQFTPGTTLIPGEKIFTIGSCFARHVENLLAEQGFSIPTQSFSIDPSEWSGNPGTLLNNYVVPAINTQIKWAFNMGEPFSVEKHCINNKGLFNDLLVAGNLRPAPAEKILARREKINQVYRNLAESRIVIVTLGLVEAWWDTRSGIYVNQAPPKSAIRADQDRFELHVLDYHDVMSACEAMLDLFKQVCPADYRLILTVSPVPLTSTFTTKDVAVANSYSKSVLRAVAEELLYRHPHIDYFPSYESFMLTNRTRAFVADQVHANQEVVAFNVNRMVDTYIAPDKESTKDEATRLRRAGNLDAALVSAKNAFEKTPEAPENITMLAKIHSELGHTEQALLLLQHPLIETHHEGLTLRAKLLNENGRFHEAVAAGEKAQQLRENAIHTLLHLANAYIGTGELDKAESLCKVIYVRGVTSQWRWSCFQLRGEIQEARGNLDEALQNYRKAQGFHHGKKTTDAIARLSKTEKPEQTSPALPLSE